MFIILVFAIIIIFLLYNFTDLKSNKTYKIVDKKSSVIDIMNVNDGLSQVLVYLYQPLSNYKDVTIIVIHGANKDAKEYCEYLIPLADKYGLNIAASLFDVKNYMKGGSNKSGEWSFANATRVFDTIIKNLESKRYILVGHSGGSQFLNRYMLKENNTADGIILANAGTYAFPSTLTPWPYGFGNYQVWSKVFTQKVIILLGEKDTNSSAEAGVLDVSEYANQQGANRFERGIKFYEVCDSTSEKLNVPFKWNLHIVPKTGHNAKKMFQSQQMEDVLQSIIFN